MKSYYIVVPASLTTKKIQKEIDQSNLNIDYLYWLVSQILIKNNYNLDGIPENEWKPLCSKLLEKYPYDYKPHLKFLCSDNSGLDKVLWRNNYALGKCYSYKLSNSFFMDKGRIHEITDKKLLRHLKKLYPNNISYNYKFERRYKFLAKYFKDNNLQINAQEAIDKNNELFNDGYFNPTKKVFKQRNNLIQICSILNQKFEINFNPNTDGRIHTVITSLSKPLRQYVTYKGELLSEVDLTSSVPLFCYYILKSAAGFNTNTHFNKIIHQSKTEYPFEMFNVKANKLDKDEIERFGRKILDGTFYSSFVEVLNLIDDNDEKFDKEKYLKNIKGSNSHHAKQLQKIMKKPILSMMNAKESKFKTEQELFKNQFPTILGWINEFKKDNHKLFSYLMLQTESYFMLDVVARTLNNDPTNKMPLITLHDCLVTTQKNLDILYGKMEDILSKELGFTPMLTKEEW